MDVRLLTSLVFLGVVGVGALAIFIFDLTKKKRIEVLKEWLLLAVIQAEKELGGGTGQIKLRFVYDLFLSKFTWLSNFISFDVFSMLVDEALVKMRHLLDTNADISNYISK